MPMRSPRRPAWAAASTHSRPFLSISGVLPRERAIEKIKPLPKILQQEGQGGGRSQLEGIDETLATLQGGNSRRRDQHVSKCPNGRRHARIRQRVTAESCRTRRLCCRDPPDGTSPTDSVWTSAICTGIRYGTKSCDLLRQVRVSSARIPPSVPRCSDRTARMRRPLQAYPIKARNSSRACTSLISAPEDCTGCELCVEICPAVSKTDPTYKALNMPTSCVAQLGKGKLGVLPQSAGIRPH